MKASALFHFSLYFLLSCAFGGEFPPDLLGGSAVDFEAASSRRFPVGGVADDVKRPMTELVDFRLSPGASIDNGFVLSEGQPALMTMILKGNPEKSAELEQLEKEDRAARRKNETPLLVEFDLPAGVTLADCADGTVVAATEKDGRRHCRIAMSADFDAGLWKIKGRYNWWRRMAFLVTPSVAAGEGLSPARAWLSWKGERISNVQEIVFSVIARLPRVASPKRFYIGCETASHVTGLSSGGFAAWADFITGCGLNALHVNLGAEPAKRDERMKALRSAGVREVSVMPSTRVYNGYDICARQPPPAADRFVSHPKAFSAAGGEANRAHVEKGLCPSAVYERRDYFMNEVVPSLRRELAPYDGVWSNWEPYMACGKGCFCDVCRKKFAAFAGLSEEEMAKSWPEQMLAKGRHAKSFVQFQSAEHGKLMRVLNEEIGKLCRSGSDIGFVPGVAWCTMCSTWRTNGYERATSPIDYAGDFRWISPWGPYAVWMSQEPYAYSKWRNLRTFAAARDVRNQVDADYPEGKRPKLMAYPHGYQGDEWIIRPEAMEMNVDSFFFNGWQAALLYRFPNGYDQRWWAAFARSAEKAARYEDIVFDGRRCDGEVELEVTSPFAMDNSDSGQWTRGLPIRLPMLQHVAYEKDGKLIVACFNFWEKAPVFFRIRRNGKDLGEFYCGALRTKVWEFGKGAAPRGFADEDVAAWRKALSGKLSRAAAQDRAFEGVPDLRVGVLSDIHVVEDAKAPWSKTSVAFFEKTLRWYREQGVDAVLVAGDLADNGKVSQLVAIGEAWKRVFPGNKGKDGRTVEKLFCYGNHDIGWKSLWEMPGENIKDDPAAAWERAFGEKWEPVSLKTVKGYPFVGVNWQHEKELGAFLKSKSFPTERPIFVYQHPNIRGTLYGGTVWGMDNGEGVRVLSAYPSAVAFSGHSHVTLTDPRSLWQGAFTAVGTSTLTYAHPSETDGPTHENIKTAARRDEHAHTLFDEMGRQGMVMEVFGSHVVLSRWDLLRQERLGADWSFDVPVTPSAVEASAARTELTQPPQFAAGAKGRAEFKSGRNYKSWWDRVGTEEPQVVVSFDAAQSPDEASRAWDYVVEAVADGRTVKTRYVYQPGNVLSVDRSAPRVTCPFPRSDFPPDAKELSFRVTPRDVRGRKGEAMTVRADDISVTDCGAKTDGSKCTDAFARAVDACTKAGGGRVVVPKGRWLTGPIHLASNCELHLEDGAEVVFSQDPKDCLPAVPTSWEGMECWNYSPLVYAYGCTNVAITGKGTLRAYDGEFKDSFWAAWRSSALVRPTRRQLYDWAATDYPVEKRRMTEVERPYLRPQFIQFTRCNGIRLEGFRIRESPFWTIHLYHSENAVVRDLDVVCTGANSDGVDIEMTRNVLVERCSFDQGDDTFVIKSGRNRDAWRLNRPTENVEIRDCHFARARSFFCCGSEISGGVRNVWMHDCSVGSCGRLCYVKTNRRRGGFVENVRVENVKAGKADAILSVETDVMYEWAAFPDYELRTTRIGGIALANVTADEVMTRVDIRGDAAAPVRGVRLADVRAGTARTRDRFVNVTDVVEEGKDVLTARTYSIADFGARTEDATEALARAVEAAAVAGGGRVLVPAGDWSCGPLDLKSGVELCLLSSARLVMKDDPALYLRPDGTCRPLVQAVGASDVRLSSGMGRIEALTDGWRAVEPSKRPPLVGFSNCTNVVLDGVALRNAPGVVVSADATANLVVSGTEFIAGVKEGDFIRLRNCPGFYEAGNSFRIGDGRLPPEDPSHRPVAAEKAITVLGADTAAVTEEVAGRTWDKLSEDGLAADAADARVLTAGEVAALGGRQIPLCMIGDSITWAEKGDCWRKWLLHNVPEVAFVGTHTGRLGYSHAGEGGNSTPGVLARVDNPERVPDCPYYHLMIGANDSSAAKCAADVPRVASNTVERIWRIVDRLLAKPATRRVFLASILPLRCDNPFRDEAGSAANELMRTQVAGRYPTNRVVWVEYEKPLREDIDAWLGKVNFVHPKEPGYKTIARMFKPQLAALVPDSKPASPNPSLAYGVEVVNLWDDVAATSRPLIPGWYVLSFAAPKAGTYTVRLRNRTDNPKGVFDKSFTVKVAAGTRGEFEFKTGYQGYGYAESPFVIDVSDAAGAVVGVTDVQIEKMRPTRKASRYGQGVFVDATSPISAGEHLVREKFEKYTTNYTPHR